MCVRRNAEIYEFSLVCTTFHGSRKLLVLQSQVSKNSLQKVKSNISSTSSVQKLSTDCEIWHFFHLKCTKTLYRRRNFIVLQSQAPKNSLQTVKSNISSISSVRKLCTEGENFEFFNLKCPKTLYRLWNFLVLHSQVAENSVQKVKSHSSSISNVRKLCTEGENTEFCHFICVKSLHRM